MNRAQRREAEKSLSRDERIRQEYERQMQERFIKCNAKMHERYIELLEEYVPQWAQKTALFCLRAHRPFEIAFNIWPSQLRRTIQYQTTSPALKFLAQLIIYLPIHLITTILTLFTVWPLATLGRTLAVPFKRWGIKSDRRMKKEGVMQLIVHKRRWFFGKELLEDSEWII